MTDNNTKDVPESRRAPDGQVWQCQACGKKAEDRYGIVGWHSYGWDESCMLNASPVPDTRGASNNGN